MSLQSHIDALRERHAELELRIAAEDQRPKPDSEALARLKVEKLRLKDELERLRSVAMAAASA
ncbi:MAG: YdcH family protein [Acetobacteraceae bacterium]